MRNKRPWGKRITLIRVTSRTTSQTIDNIYKTTTITSSSNLYRYRLETHLSTNYDNSIHSEKNFHFLFFQYRRQIEFFFEKALLMCKCLKEIWKHNSISQLVQEKSGLFYKPTGIASWGGVVSKIV